MSAENKSIESLIAGGLIGAALGAMLSRDKDDGAMVGALLGAIFSATLKANREAQKTNQPVLIAEDGKLYQVFANGEKKFIRDLPRSSGTWPEYYKLK